jgi:hypothetical protein
MSQRPTLDPSSFERLLAAAWVLQRQHEQKARNRRPATDETLAEPPETEVEPHCVSERDTTGACLMAALSKLREAAEPAVNQNTALGRAPTLNGIELLILPPERQAGDQEPAHLGQSLRHALLSLLNVAESAKNRLESFARYRVKVWVTFDSKPTLSPRRAVAAPGAPLLVLLIMVAFTLLQVWHGEHFHTVAAMSRMNHQSEENAVRKAEQFRPTPAVQVSHRQVTDRGVLSVVEALSRYEIRGLRRQADYGDDSAAFIMGMVYETGRYVPQSCTKAADWVTRSANAGSAAAQYNLGLRYRDGDGLPANEDEAEKWLGKAANQRYSNARLALETLTSRDARVRLVRRGEFEIRRRNTVGRRPSSSHVGGAL